MFVGEYDKDAYVSVTCFLREIILQNGDGGKKRLGLAWLLDIMKVLASDGSDFHKMSCEDVLYTLLLMIGLYLNSTILNT
jgi:hypothetical protein